MQSLLSLILLLGIHWQVMLVTSFHLSPNVLSNQIRQTLGVPILSSLRSTADEEGEGDDFEILFGEAEGPPLGAIEKAWRYAKKPLLSIGAKGATFAHGNSLRQLLESHTIVKVKVNTSKFGTYS